VIFDYIVASRRRASPVTKSHARAALVAKRRGRHGPTGADSLTQANFIEPVSSFHLGRRVAHELH